MNDHTQGDTLEDGYIPWGELPSVETEVRDFPTLPEGYAYDKREDIANKRELADLMNAANVDKPEATPQELDELDHFLYGHGVRSRGIGVRDLDGDLVGYALVVYKSNHAEFASLCVHPNHQGLGIGRALVDARLQFVEKEAIESICIPELLSTNSLRTYYLQHGFQATPEGRMVRGPDPKTMEEVCNPI